MKKRSEERCFKPIWGPFGYRMLIGNSYAERPVGCLPSCLHRYINGIRHHEFNLVVVVTALSCPAFHICVRNHKSESTL